MGGDLAGDGAARARGEGALCGKQQLRGMAYRPGKRRRIVAQFYGTGFGAEHLLAA